ncbi:MAG TPA: GNAT family N-acetyltransferase [Methanocorpusculum sp.]|nr:GNAT family N-acetyltransferase [Methanocorpusculum sp.]
MQTEIREMNKTDFPTVQAIFAQSISKGIFTFRPEVPSAEEWDASHLPFSRFIITVDSVTAGWCALSPVSSRECYKGVAEVSIYIDEQYQGRGLGTALLTRLCTEAAAHGIWSLLAVVIAGNEASLHLHRKCGFREIGYRERIAKDIFGNWRNTIMFEKRL